MSSTVHVYLSQSDRGELVTGAGIDGYNSYAQRGSPMILEDMLAAAVELFPVFSRIKMMRQWAGLIDEMTQVAGRQLYPRETEALATAKLIADLPIAYHYVSSLIKDGLYEFFNIPTKVLVVSVGVYDNIRSKFEGLAYSKDECLCQTLVVSQT